MSSEIQKSQLTIIHEPLATGGPYKSSWSIYAEVLPFLLVFFIDHVSRSRIRSSICVRVRGIWVAVAPRIQRCFLQSIATRFVRKLSSRASGVGRSSAKRMYVHSFYVIRTNTYTFYVRIFVYIYTRDFRVSTSSASDTLRLFSWAHTLSHTHIYILACLPGRVVKKKIKEPGFWSLVMVLIL
jgi:hypothetical protein